MWKIKTLFSHRIWDPLFITGKNILWHLFFKNSVGNLCWIGRTANSKLNILTGFVQLEYFGSTESYQYVLCVFNSDLKTKSNFKNKNPRTEGKENSLASVWTFIYVYVFLASWCLWKFSPLYLWGKKIHLLTAWRNYAMCFAQLPMAPGNHVNEPY